MPHLCLLLHRRVLGADVVSAIPPDRTSAADASIQVQGQLCVRRAGVPAAVLRAVRRQRGERQMAITAFTTRAAEDLDEVAQDIATTTRDANTSPAAVQALHQRYHDLRNAAAGHSHLLSNIDLVAGGPPCQDQ